METAQYGITCNAVCPAYVLTDSKFVCVCVPTHTLCPHPLTPFLAVVIPQIQTRADKEGTTFAEAKVGPKDDEAVDAV